MAAFRRRKEVLEEYILKAIRGLPEVDRRIFVLKHYRGLSEKDICRFLGLRVGQVRDSLRQSSRALLCNLHPLTRQN